MTKQKTSSSHAAGRIDSRTKGAAAEREFAALVLDLTGVKLERCLEQARGGGHDLEPVEDDPAAQAMRRFAIEVKRHAVITNAKLAVFWRQAEEQAARASRTPVLAFRADRHEWRVLVPLRALNRSYGAWSGIQWTAQVSAEAFCSLVREMASDPATLPAIPAIAD